MVLVWCHRKCHLLYSKASQNARKSTKNYFNLYLSIDKIWIRLNFVTAFWRIFKTKIIENSAGNPSLPWWSLWNISFMLSFTFIACVSKVCWYESRQEFWWTLFLSIPSYDDLFSVFFVSLKGMNNELSREWRGKNTETPLKRQDWNQAT
jgi:hypothetical protein